MPMISFRSAFSFSVLAIAAASLSGCQGTVVIAPFPHCSTDPVEVCHDYVDFAGIVHRECGIQYERHCWDVAGAPVGAVTLANDYAVSFASADRLIGAAVEVNHGNLAAASQLGLGQADMENMAAQQLPTEQGINSVARTLNQDPSSVRNLFSGIMSETRTRLSGK